MELLPEALNVEEITSSVIKMIIFPQYNTTGKTNTGSSIMYSSFIYSKKLSYQ